MANADSIVKMDTHSTDIKESILDSTFNEEKWVSVMKSLLNKENLYELDRSPSIFQVPKSVRAVKPEAYTPQTIALGPYHNFQPEIYKTQRLKLSQARLLRQEFSLPDFQVLSDQLKRKVGDIRAYYYEHLDIHDDTLSWIMVINGLFLLKLMYKGGAEAELVDSSGRRVSMDSILKDAVMIENQIPFFVLELLYAVARSYPPSETRSILVKTMMFCQRISPIFLTGRFLRTEFESLHVLDILYNLVCFGRLPVGDWAEQRSSGLSCDIWKMLSSAMNFSFLYIPKKILDLIILFFEVLGITISLEAVEEKALVPTVSQLSNVKVKLHGITTGIMGIEFKTEDAALWLPVLTLNVNSEVIIRNLLVYEAVAKPETPDFARYIQTIAALVQTTEDVELLKNNKIVIHNGDNGEVVKLFNGIKDCVSDCKSRILDCVINNINEYYDNTWKIKCKRVMKKYVYSSWKMLTILATVLVLLLMTLQTFCSFYRCPDIFKTSIKTHLSSIYSL